MNGCESTVAGGSRAIAQARASTRTFIVIRSPISGQIKAVRLGAGHGLIVKRHRIVLVGAMDDESDARPIALDLHAAAVSHALLLVSSPAGVCSPRANGTWRS